MIPDNKKHEFIAQPFLKTTAYICKHCGRVRTASNVNDRCPLR